MTREVDNVPRVDRYRALSGLSEMMSDDIAIAGVGAVGRQIAMTLATMGAAHLTIYDFDTVEEENLGPQGYDPASIKMSKVRAMGIDISRRNPDCELFPVNGKYPEDQLRVHATLFICVDSMDSRNDIGEGRSPLGKLMKQNSRGYNYWEVDDVMSTLPVERIIDTRMACMSGRIITDTPPFHGWMSTLFPESEAAIEPCSLRMTAFGAGIVANLAVHEYMALLQGRDPVDLQLDIMARAIIKNPHYQDSRWETVLA